MDRVRAVLSVIEDQLDAARLEFYRALGNDPQLFTVEVLAAHQQGELQLPDELVRELHGSMDDPFESSESRR